MIAKQVYEEQHHDQRPTYDKRRKELETHEMSIHLPKESFFVRVVTVHLKEQTKTEYILFDSRPHNNL